MKYLGHFPPALGRGLYYAVLAALGLLVLLRIAGLAQLPVGTTSVGCISNASGRLLA